MEGLRDVALADYENLPDEEKAKIHNDFKQLIANGDQILSDYFELLQESQPLFADQILQNCEGYEEGRLYFNDFITLNYVLEKHEEVKCDGCSSLMLGRPYFSCAECFFDFSVESYDLCSRCYRSKKFEDHNHEEFLDNEKLVRLCRGFVAGKKEDLETRNNHINRAAIEFAGKCLDFARSITTDGLETHFDFGGVLNFEKNKKLAHDSKEPEKKEDEILAMARLRLKPQEVRPRIDLMGASPSVMLYTGSSQQ